MVETDPGRRWVAFVEYKGRTIYSGQYGSPYDAAYARSKCAISFKLSVFDVELLDDDRWACDVTVMP